MFRFLNCGFSVYEMYRFITFLGTEVLFFIKKCPLKLMPENNDNQQKSVQNYCLI